MPKYIRTKDGEILDLQELTYKGIRKKAKKRDKVLNSCVNYLIRKIKRGCIKSAKKGLYEFEYDSRKFEERKEEDITFEDVLIRVNDEFLEPNKIYYEMSLSFSYLITFKWDK